MKTTLLTLTLLALLTGCSSVLSKSDEQLNIESCIEDYMDTATYPTDMDELDSIDYLASKARAHCDALYGE